MVVLWNGKADLEVAGGHEKCRCKDVPKVKKVKKTFVHTCILKKSVIFAYCSQRLNRVMWNYISMKDKRLRKTANINKEIIK